QVLSQSGLPTKHGDDAPVRWQPVVWPIRLILLAISRLGGEMLLLSPARATRSALLTIGTKQTYRGEFAHARFRSEADKPRASGARRSDENDPKRTCPGSKSCSAAVCCRAVCAIVGRAIAMDCTKNERLSVSIPLIQQAKIQAQVLVPLVKALQAELGKERANALVRRALGGVYRRYGEEFWRTKNEKNL